MQSVPSKRENALINLLYFVIICSLVFLSARYLFFPLLPLLLGSAIAALLRPAVTVFAKHFHMSERIATILTLILFYLLATAIMGLFFTILLAQLYELLLKLPTLYAQNLAPIIERAGEMIHEISGTFLHTENSQMFSNAVASAVQQAAVNGSTFLVGWVAGLAAKLPMLLLTAVFTIVISVLTALGYHKIGYFLKDLATERFAPLLSETRRFLCETVWHFIRAYTILMAITFTELSIGLWVLGFDYVMPVAAVISLVDLLPLIGSGVVLVPWGIILLAGGDLLSGAGLLILFGFMAVLRNILEPRIVSGQIGLHPIVTITAMYAGLRLGGLFGMLIAPIIILAVLRLTSFQMSRESE